MKKFLTLFLTLAVLAGTFSFPVVKADEIVSFSLVPSNIREGDTTFTVDLVAHLPEGGDVTQVGVFVDVPEGLSLVDFEKQYTGGKSTYICSQTYDVNPFWILWVLGIASLPEGDTVMCTLTFEADEPFTYDDSYYIGLKVDPDNPPATVAGYEVEAYCFSCTAEVAPPPVEFSLVAGEVFEGDTTFTVDLTVTLPEDATGYELGSFCVEMSYDSSVMHLADAPEWKVAGGSRENSKELTDMPYKLAWLSIDEEEQFSAGKNVIATMTFELSEPAVRSNEYTISLAGNPKNFVVSMASEDGVHSEFKYDPDDVSFENAVFSTIINYGDVNSDDIINVFDVSLMLRYVVGWTDFEFDEVAADVNLDGDVTLLDASRTLKYIAKWNGITLGTR